MRQLTALDAQFLSAESATTAAHVAGVAILDPASAPSGTVTRDGLINLLRERLHLAPPLRMRLADVPLGLDRPYWTEDPDFDLRNHVHECTLPTPGDDQRLADQVARIHERRLDRRHPLWEMHLVHGLSGGRVAVYTKVHHSAIDGVSAAEILGSLLDLSPEPRLLETPPEQEPETAPGLVGMLAGALTRSVTQPIETVLSLTRAAADLDAIPLAATIPGARLVAKATRMVVGNSKPLPELPSLSAPRTPLNGRISGERLFAYGSIPLADVRRVARTFGMSVNDVVMTLCSSALRTWLRSQDALPGQPLVAAIPVAVRTANGSETIGNQISAMITPLATDVACPKERLAATRATMATAKRRFAVSPTSWLSDICSLVPAAFAAITTPALFRLAALATPGVNLIVSNVPGPQFPLFMCGARVQAYYPMSVLTDLTGALNITCISYDGRLDFGVVACPNRVPDVWSLIDHLRDAMTELNALADAEHPPVAETATKIPGKTAKKATRETARKPVREKVPA
jgi:WS/DGAT/MGAT family acyltransferase